MEHKEKSNIRDEIKVLGLTRKININWAREDWGGGCFRGGKQGVLLETSWVWDACLISKGDDKQKIG